MFYENFTNFLTHLNTNYANLLLVVVASVTAYYAYKEIVLRHRPYVIPEIVIEINNDKWFFHILLVNKGEKPGIARISKALLIIGDEEYPTNFKFEAILAPNEKQKLAPMGHINKLGRNKILGHEYRNNRVEISVETEARSVKDKKFKYKTKCEYKVEVLGEKPEIQLISEEII